MDIGLLDFLEYTASHGPYLVRLSVMLCLSNLYPTQHVLPNALESRSTGIQVCYRCIYNKVFEKDANINFFSVQSKIKQIKYSTKVNR